MGLHHVVVTSVARDDLPDGGAGIFAETILAIRRRQDVAKVEVLIPDFAGSDDALRKVMEAGPDVLNHNLETVERLQSKVRAKARYGRSLHVLERAKELAPGGTVKSGIMLGVGEEWDEIVATMHDLRGSGLRRNDDWPIYAPVAEPPSNRAILPACRVRSASGCRNVDGVPPRRIRPLGPELLPRPQTRIGACLPLSDPTTESAAP